MIFPIEYTHYPSLLPEWVTPDHAIVHVELPSDSEC